MSTPWRSEKIRRPRALVQPFVDKIASEMPDGVEFHFGGSWRRGAPIVGDLDILVVVEGGTFDASLFSPGVQLPPSVTVQRSGPKVVNGDLTLDGQTIHVDFWACAPNERGAFLMYFTGPRELNIGQRASAIRQGYTLSQNGLLDRRKNQVDDGTEADIYRILGFPTDLLDPTARQSFAKPQGPGVIVRQVVGSKPGNKYTVKIKGEQASCTCKGFQYRQYCKHVTALRDELKIEGPLVAAQGL